MTRWMDVEGRSLGDVAKYGSFESNLIFKALRNQPWKIESCIYTD